MVFGKDLGNLKHREVLSVAPENIIRMDVERIRYL
jgi:hypothetical protein